MKLIGMLDSPYVRRVAISLECLGIPFQHEAVSVFSTSEEFKSINPVVKAPTLICDDGEILMDSTLILIYAERLAPAEKSLLPSAPTELQHALRAIGLALAACDKSVQIVYERSLRPKASQYQPWIDRVTGQLLAAYDGLEREVKSRGEMFAGLLNQAAITAAVAWQFTQSMLPEVVPTTDHPALVRLSVYSEQLPSFTKYPPVGPGVVATHNH